MIPQPSIIPISDSGSETYELAADYTYTWRAEGKRWRIIIKAGFRTDAASVPWIATVLTGITPDGLHRAGALVHDFLYRHGGRLPHGSFCSLNVANGHWVPVAHAWTRQQADKMFANMLQEAGVSKFRRRMMYRAVRAFGWRSWQARD